MADFRVTVSDRKTGSAHQIEISGSQANKFIGARLSDTIAGDAVGLPGYTLKITGGTDKDGFPMRIGLPGSNRRKILVAGGVGFKSQVKGMRRRKTIRGEEISADIGQINTVIEDYGSKSVEELLGGEPEEAAEAAAEPGEEVAGEAPEPAEETAEAAAADSEEKTD